MTGSSIFLGVGYATRVPAGWIALPWHWGEGSKFNTGTYFGSACTWGHDDSLRLVNAQQSIQS